MPNSFCMIIIEAIDSGTLHYKEEFLESGCFLNAENNLWSKAKTIKNGAARLCRLVSTSLISCTSQKKKKQLPCVFLKVKKYSRTRELFQGICAAVPRWVSSCHPIIIRSFVSSQAEITNSAKIFQCAFEAILFSFPFSGIIDWISILVLGIRKLKRYPNQFLNFKT